jgi:tetratricopeptide (TPR) repeat protein
MAAVTRDNPRILVGASIPRSGHHFLADMMTAYYGDDLYYCEYYTLPSCCRSVPCTRRGNHRIVYQKSHDRDFSLAAGVQEALYLIQYRQPVPEALSDRELELKEKPGRPSLAYRQTHAGYLNWLASKAIYYRKFHDKWIAGKLPNAIYLDYAELASDPKKFLKLIVEQTTGDPDDARLDAVVEKTRSPRSNASFKPRVIADSPYFDAQMLGAFEAWVLERCPLFNFPSELHGSYAGSELYGLILMKDSTEPLPAGETKRLKAAANLAPNHPELQRRLAGRAIREGRVTQGLKKLEKLIAANPYYGAGYSVLFTACADAGVPVPGAVLTEDALVACAESAELAIQLGNAFGEKGRWAKAVKAFELALVLEPENPEASARHMAAVQAAK